MKKKSVIPVNICFIQLPYSLLFIVYVVSVFSASYLYVLCVMKHISEKGN